jgi:hypothetical protein
MHYLIELTIVITFTILFLYTTSQIRQLIENKTHKKENPNCKNCPNHHKCESCTNNTDSTGTCEVCGTKCGESRTLEQAYESDDPANNYSQ